MTTSARPVLDVKGLSVTFRLSGKLLTPVSDVSFCVNAGRTTALVGESGSGKSTIAQAIMGLLPPNGRIAKGNIWFHDPAADSRPVDLAALKPSDPAFRALRGSRLAIVFQDPAAALSPLHTVGDQISEVLRATRGMSRAESLAEARDMLALSGFPDPGRGLRAYPHELSGGLRQRAMIAAALIANPALLIADEPTTALDVTLQAQILSLLENLQNRFGMGLLLISHDLGVVATLADDTVVLREGEVVESGATGTLLTAPRHPYLKHLLETAPRADVAPHAAPVRRPEAREIIRLESVSRHFHARKPGGAPQDPAGTQTIRAVEAVDLVLHEGECLGLVGESGSGKTTLARLILRVLRPDYGRILYRDETGSVRDLNALSTDELQSYRRAVQYIFQDPVSALDPRMTVFGSVSEPLRLHETDATGDRPSLRERTAELLDLVGLEPDLMSRYPHALSGGQRQRAVIARALALNPRLLLCDEPVSALDVSVQAQILELLNDLRRRLNLTLLFVSHNLAVVNEIADRVAVMSKGVIVELGPRAALFEAPAHPYTRSLLAAVPHTDPALRLDLEAAMRLCSRDPQEWPEPFGFTSAARTIMHHMGGGHFVRRVPDGASQRQAAASAGAW